MYDIILCADKQYFCPEVRNMLHSLISNVPVYSADKVAPERNRTVCITGHREKSIPSYLNNPIYRNITIASVKLMLYRYIDMAAESGYENFISGLAVGIDLWAAEYIIKKKKTNKKLCLIGAMPYLRHAERFPKFYREMLADVEKNADYLVTVNDNPSITYGSSSLGANFSRDLYRNRNYYMVDNSSAVIAFLNSNSNFSGTSQTVNYARRTGCNVKSFGIDDLFDIITSAGPDIRQIGREISFLSNVFNGSY